MNKIKQVQSMFCFSSTFYLFYNSDYKIECNNKLN
jgi:hypothetical protein